MQRDATWQPNDIAPMHPEYPCAVASVGFKSNQVWRHGVLVVF